VVTEMADFLKGGAKGEPGKTSSGIRGGEDIIIKATRPFGGLHSLVQPPCHSEIFKKAKKNAGSLRGGVNNCAQVSRQLCTSEYTYCSAALGVCLRSLR